VQVFHPYFIMEIEEYPQFEQECGQDTTNPINMWLTQEQPAQVLQQDSDLAPPQK